MKRLCEVCNKEINTVAGEVPYLRSYCTPCELEGWSPITEGDLPELASALEKEGLVLQADFKISIPKTAQEKH